MESLVKTSLRDREKYLLDKFLGKATFGEIWECSLDHFGAQKFAIQQIAREHYENKYLQYLIKNELFLVERMRHPNIVRTIDLFQDEVNFYIV